jgi:hypothetical protein
MEIGMAEKEKNSEVMEESLGGSGSVEGVPKKTPCVAVVVAHGMGQQIPFETLDSVATGLINAAKRHGDPQAGEYRVERVRCGTTDAGRVDLTFSLEKTNAKIHVYEVYWAPLTEGRIGIKEVVMFLYRAGINGLQRGVQPFQRWLFGSGETLEPPIRTLIFILVALAVVLSLIMLNTALVAVGAARGLFSSDASWLTPALFADLTFIFSVVLDSMAVFAVILLASKLTSRLSIGALFRFASIAAFVCVVFIIVMAAVAVPFLASYHVGEKMPAFFPTAFSDVTSTVLGWTIGLLAAAGALVIILTLAYRLSLHPSTFSIVVFALFLLLLALIGLEIVEFTVRRQQFDTQWVITWIVLFLASAYIRNLLVQYVGDVAIYIQPQALDSFHDLRERIKKVARDTIQPVYALKDPNGGFTYDAVYLVGHSLGSVIAYDTLNTLLREDATDGEPLRITRRTKLLLTFGSPLDKTAFFFATQKKREGTNVRERLAASVQPLIDNETTRTFPWINVYSPWDIVSGNLDYYDGCKLPKLNRVCNQIDPHAVTFLWAHVEYWHNPFIFETLYHRIAEHVRSRPQP